MLKYLLTLAMLFQTSIIYGSPFSDLKEKYAASMTAHDRIFRLDSVWTGACYTAKEPDVKRGGLFVTYNPENISPFRPPFAFMTFTSPSMPDTFFEQKTDEELSEISAARISNAWPITLFYNESGWVQGRGYEAVNLKVEVDDSDTIQSIFTLTTCIGDSDICAGRFIGQGEWRYCEFNNRRL